MANVGVDVLPTLLAQSPWIAEDLAQVAGELAPPLDHAAFLSDRAGCDDGLDALRMSSIIYRIATGAQAGRKVTTLQTIPADSGSLEGDARNGSGADGLVGCEAKRSGEKVIDFPL